MKPLRRREHTEKSWLALEIGNSRLHWALFTEETLKYTWDTDYLPESAIQQLVHYQNPEELLLEICPFIQKSQISSQKETSPSPSSPPLPLLLSSVVPSQTALWQKYPDVKILTLEDIPLGNMYPTLGIDRALAVLGAGKTWGFPVMVIDAGTALTYTGADANQCLVGGAILPGLGLQLQSLGQNTGQLPQLTTKNLTLPSRFALNTPEAIQSGVIYTLLAGIKDFILAWGQLFPESKVVIKGGDSLLIYNYFQLHFPEIADRLIVEPKLIFWGMREIFIDKFV